MVNNFSDLLKRIKDEGSPDIRALPNATLAAVVESAFGIVSASIRDAGEGDVRIPRLGVFRSRRVTAKDGPSSGKPVMRTVFMQLKAASDKADEDTSGVQDSGPSAQ